MRCVRLMEVGVSKLSSQGDPKIEKLVKPR